MPNVKIKELAKRNIDLVNEIENTKNFINIFNRNFLTRVNEHLEIISNGCAGLINVNERIDDQYGGLQENMINDDLKKFVKVQFSLEIDRKNNIKKITEHITDINDLLRIIEKSDLLSIDEIKKINSTMQLSEVLKDTFDVSLDTTIRLNEYKNVLGDALSSITTAIAYKVNEIKTSIIDVGDTAAVAISSAGNDKDRRITLKWWDDAISLKENEFKVPKSKLLKIQKAFTTTQQDLKKSKQYIKKLSSTY